MATFAVMDRAEAPTARPTSVVAPVEQVPERFHVFAQQESIEAAIRTIWLAVPRRTKLPCLNYIILRTTEGRLSFTASNLDLTITATCDAMVTGEGSIAAPARLFGDYMKALPSVVVNLSESPTETYVVHNHPLVNGHWARLPALAVQAGRNTSTLCTYPIEDFPRLPEWPEHGEPIAMPECIASLTKNWNYAVLPTVVRSGKFLHFRTERRVGGTRSSTYIDVHGAVTV